MNVARKLFPMILAFAATVPGVTTRLLGLYLEAPVQALVSGAAIFGAAFVLVWACDAAQADISQALALAGVALLAVLPEYAVDMYFTWQAGTNPGSDYANFAIANMTGANRRQPAPDRRGVGRGRGDLLREDAPARAPRRRPPHRAVLPGPRHRLRARHPDQGLARLVRRRRVPGHLQLVHGAGRQTPGAKRAKRTDRRRSSSRCPRRVAASSPWPCFWSPAASSWPTRSRSVKA